MKKCAQICIIGKPNAGKSTLLNSLIGQKIAITTHKVQTTRSLLTGILTKDDTQLIFIDTPGIFIPKKSLEKSMVRAAWSSLMGSDFICLIIDSSKAIDEEMLNIFDILTTKNINFIVLLNKIDKAKIENIKLLNDKLTAYGNIIAVFQISALNKTNINGFITYLISNSPKAEWLYDEDEITTAPMRFLASEIVREKLFLNLNQELPYNLTVETERWQQLDNGDNIVHQIIYVTRESHKMIILGHKGQNIKKISHEARSDISKSLNINIHLYLFIKVKPNWENMIEMYDYMGLKKS